MFAVGSKSRIPLTESYPWKAGEFRPHWLIIAARLKRLRKTNFMCEVRT